MDNLVRMGQQAQVSEQRLALLTTPIKNQALRRMATALRQAQAQILESNQEDLAAALMMPQKFVDRLRLNAERIEEMARGLEVVASLDDPTARIDQGWVTADGLEIIQRRVPLGVLGIIFEARPNVVADAAGLAFKAGNAVILRGGKEALRSNQAIVASLRHALSEEGLPEDAIQLVEDTSHETANKMMMLNDYLDVLIPRGSRRLIQQVVKTATVPVIETGAGNCHLYIDRDADLSMAREIVVNAKVQRPSVCNAAEKLLIHQDVAQEVLSEVVVALRDQRVQVRGDDRSRMIMPDLGVAVNEDWDTEYNDLIMAVKIVDSLDEAVTWINAHSTHHSEAIITRNISRGRYFQQRVNSACVYVNASTRFTDGGTFGFGAEIGISTQKLHARGPMGLEQLTTIKYEITGDGQVRH